MSHVILLCADRPLPLYNSHTRRVRTEGAVTVERDGFSVQANEYYRQAVEELDFPMKPCRYELDLEATDRDAGLLRAYLEGQLRPGEEAQLWSVWVPHYPEDGLSRYRGRLEELDGEALAPLEGWNVCMTVER